MNVYTETVYLVLFCELCVTERILWMIDFSGGQISAAVMAVGFHLDFTRWNPIGPILTDNHLLGGWLLLFKKRNLN